MSTQRVESGGLEARDALEVIKLHIGGHNVTSEASFEVKSPATGKPIRRVWGAGVHEANEAVAAAAAALPSWRDTPPQVRRDILLRAAEIVIQRKDEFWHHFSEEIGGQRPFCEVNHRLSREIILDVASRVTTLEDRSPRLSSPDQGAIVFREPYGVVLAIAPWYVC